MKPPRLNCLAYRLTLEGYNPERLMNKLSKDGISFLAVRRESLRRLVCECYAADMPYIRQTLEDKGWKLLECRPLRLCAALVFLRRRFGIPIGLVLAIILSIVMYRFVWRVEIQGAGPYQGDIAIFLREEGLGVGTPKSGVDAAQLVRKLNHRYPKVAWFNAYVHDITLVVDCTLGVLPPDTPSPEPGDLLATRDGVVSLIQVHAGTAMVKPGDVVREGQVLIAGSERSSDETLRPVHARGTVLARCWVSRSVNLPLTQTQSVETGRELETVTLMTPWITWPVEPQTPDFLAYDTQRSETPLVGSFFPCWVRRDLYREVAMEYVARDAAEVRAEAEKAALQKLAEALGSNEIVDKWVDYCMIENDSLTATATAELSVDIGGGAPP